MKFRTRKPAPAPDAPAADGQVIPKVPAQAVQPAGVFLGSLRSEVDEPDRVPESFEQVAALTESVVGAYRRRLLTEDEVAQRLAVLRLRDGDGVEWSLGATSMRWYRRLPGGAWKRSVPSQSEDDALVRSADEAIERLGQFPPPAPRAASPEPVREPDTASVEPLDVVLPATSRTIESLPPVFVSDFDPDGYENEPEPEGYGYGDDPLPQAVPATPLSSAPGWNPPAAGYGEDEDQQDGSALLSAVSVGENVVAEGREEGLEPTAAGDVDAEPATADEDGAGAEGTASDPELLAMLATLSSQTGIALTGVPPRQD